MGVDFSDNATLNSGRMLINLKRFNGGKISASDVMHRFTTGTGETGAGITLYVQPVQDLTVEDRVSRTQFRYTLRGRERR